MHPDRTVRAALELGAEGLNASEVERQLGVPRCTVRQWFRGALPHTSRSEQGYCCLTRHHFNALSSSYVYLLGLYLGDGCISKHARGVYRLRIVLDIKYPGIIESTADAVRENRRGKALIQMRPKNCVEVSAYWQHWPCLFPQHGPGKKHDRRIALTDWQQLLVNRWPEQLLRGLIHSDGCRFQNTGSRWSWPRYSFANHSDDIRSIFCDTCDRLGVRWTRSGPYAVYVSRKADVATLDRFIGPKT